MDIKKILAGRKIVDDYRSVQALPHEEGLSAKLLEAIQALGFKNHQAFYDANEEANYRERIRCYILQNECDHCVGRVIGCFPNTAECSRDIYVQKTDYAAVAQVAATGSSLLRDRALKGEFNLIQLRNIFGPFFTWRNYPGNLPPGCSHKYNQVDAPAFDIYWGMNPGVNVERHEERRATWGINKVK